MKGLLKQNKGITLIALVITIIVIVILTAITINAVVGDNGIITETKQARDDYYTAENAEQQTLDSAVSAIRSAREEAGLPSSGSGSSGSGNSGSSGATLTLTELRSNDMFSRTTNSKYIDTSLQTNNEVIIPAGYKMTSDTDKINEGIVIEDANGNQWVWIPVDNPSEMYEQVETPIALSGQTGVTTYLYSKSNIINNNPRVVPAGDGVREPDLNTSFDKESNSSYLNQAGFIATTGENAKTATQVMAEFLVNDYRNMIESITLNKGFYVGRFELSGTTVNPQIVKNATVLTSANWYQYFNACTKFSSNSAEGRMIWGCLRDEVCKFIGTRGTVVDIYDSSTYGNYYNSQSPADISGHGTIQNTGSSEYWKTHNIYDFAGNCHEFTQEAKNDSTYGRVNFGGLKDIYGIDNAVSVRGSYMPTQAYSTHSTRAVLYIK